MYAALYDDERGREMPTATTSRARTEGTQVARAAAGQGRQVAGQAAEEAQDLKATAAERGGEIVRVAKQDARELAGTVRARAGEVTEQLSSQGRSLIEETRSQLQAQTRAGGDKVAGAFRQFGEQAQALAEGRPEDAPTLSEYAWKAADGCYAAADRIHGLAEEIETRGFGGFLQVVQGFARRRPGTFLVGALALGFGVGRLVKANSSDGDTDEGESEEARAPRRALPAASRGTR